MKNNKLCYKISTAESVSGGRPVLASGGMCRSRKAALFGRNDDLWGGKTVEEERRGERCGGGGDNSPCLCSLLPLNLYEKKKKKKGERRGFCICIQSESPLQPPFALSAVYIKSLSRSRCQPIKYIHFPGFYSAAHLLNIFEWHPLNSFQFAFKAGFIGTTDV